MIQSPHASNSQTAMNPLTIAPPIGKTETSTKTQLLFALATAESRFFSPTLTF